jgi:hypothetical protein
MELLNLAELFRLIADRLLVARYLAADPEGRLQARKTGLMVPRP